MLVVNAVEVIIVSLCVGFSFRGWLEGHQELKRVRKENKAGNPVTTAEMREQAAKFRELAEEIRYAGGFGSAHAEVAAIEAAGTILTLVYWLERKEARNA